MQWHEWNEDAFQRARERECPVLLFLRASWCQWCRELEQRVLADERVVRVLSDRYVCVQVDKDRRPDIDERFRHGGWPTLAWLDAEAKLLECTNFLEPDELLERLTRIADGRPAPAAPTVAEAPADAEARLSLDMVDEIHRTLLRTADPTNGGWGTRQKFPHPEALHFLTVRWSQTGDPDTLGVVRRTLRKMQAGEIHDTVEGGFYRYATQPDWSVPHHGKMLDGNARRLLAYVEAYQALGEPSFRETAEGILSWMHETLLDPKTQAFRGSQDADPEYAHLKSRKARERRGAPECDPTIFTNWNAEAVMALLKASVVFDENRYAVQALATLDFLMENLWDQREGMYHYWDGTYNLPGLLADQAATLRALVEAMHYVGESRYLSAAHDLAQVTAAHLRAPDGSFYATRYNPRERGRKHARDRSLMENAVLAEALLRLGHMTRVREYTEWGQEALAAFAADYKRFGHFVAGYGRAVDLVFHEPVHVTIVGPRDADITRTLRDTALRPYIASRIVQTIDPIEDRELFEGTGLPMPLEEGGARAYVHQGRLSYAETSRPARLVALLARAERSN